MGLPSLTSLSCSSPAASLAIGGLATVCPVAAVASAVGGAVVSQVAGAGVDAVLDALGGWVADGASWLLGRIGAALSATTSIDLGASWFSSHYTTMAVLAAAVVVPLLLLGVLQAVFRQNVSMLLRSVLVHVPLALLLTAVAVQLVQMGLALTDALSASVAQGAGLDGGHFFSAVTLELTAVQAAGATPVPAFVLFLGSLAVVFGAMFLWVELMVRAAAIYAAVLFLPLALAGLAWPAIAHWSRRLADTLAALVLGKFVIVSVLSLAAGELAAGTGTGGGGGSAGGFTTVLGGAALLLLAAFSPWALFRLLPFMEAGAVGHLEGVAQRARHAASAPPRALAQQALRLAGAAALGGPAAAAMAAAGGMGDAAAGEGASGGDGLSPLGGPSGRDPSDPLGGEGEDAGSPTDADDGADGDGFSGRGIPMAEPHPEATALWQSYLRGEYVPDDGPWPGAGAADAGAGGTGGGGTGGPGAGTGPDGGAGVRPGAVPGGGAAPDAGWGAVAPPGWGSASGPSPGPLPDAGTGPGQASSEVLVPLPQATGTSRRHALGADGLGPRLVTLSDAEHPAPSAPAADDPLAPPPTGIPGGPGE